MDLQALDIIGREALERQKLVFDGSARQARILETQLLTQIFASEAPAFEDICEELAIHFSVDVTIPERFIEWLHRLNGRAKLALEILGLQSDDSGEEGLNGLAATEMIFDFFNPSGDRVQDKTSKRRKIAIRRHSNGSGIVNERFQVELDFSHLLSQQRHLSNGNGTCQKRASSPRKRNLDQTVVLTTPPKLVIPSRSSTPGCSQCVQKLSLKDS